MMPAAVAIAATVAVATGAGGADVDPTVASASSARLFAGQLEPIAQAACSPPTLTSPTAATALDASRTPEAPRTGPTILACRSGTRWARPFEGLPYGVVQVAGGFTWSYSQIWKKASRSAPEASSKTAWNSSAVAAESS